MNDPTDHPSRDPQPVDRRRWPPIVVNALLMVAILALLFATWMPAIYDRLKK